MFIGIDLINIHRIKKIIDNKGDIFINRIFTKLEINICKNKYKPYIHFSGKYAAKEAVKKAIISSRIIKSISLKNIEIDNENSGAPSIRIINNKIKYKNIKISISHDGEYAIATALLELK